jgi:predicted enzyme related to lactoylglutathione lyase
VHLDVVASEHHRWADVMAAADRAVELGGALVRESDDPNDRFVTLTDPEGNEFCLVARNAGAGAANEL